MIGVVVSTADEASVAIGEALLARGEWTRRTEQDETGEHTDSSDEGETERADRSDGAGNEYVDRSDGRETERADSSDGRETERADRSDDARGEYADRANETRNEYADRVGEADDDRDRLPAPSSGVYYRSATEPVIELRVFADLHLSIAHPERAFSEQPTAVVFASRHSGDTGPLLTCHPTGNFGEATYGGADRSFAPAAPGISRALLAGFDAHAPAAYEVGIECTHHGPTAVDVPSVFAELGSSESEWRDPDGARAVAAAIHDLPARDATPTVGDSADPRHVLGIGGGHYAPRFERVTRETAWGVGHIASDWQLDELGEPTANADTLVRAARASDASVALVTDAAPAVRDALADTPIRVVGERWVRTVGDRSLDRVTELEAALCPVADGLRFGDCDGTYTVASLPDELLAETLGIDADATRAAVTATTVAYETTENGTRPTGRAAFPPDGRERLVERLAERLTERYETVERTDNAIHVSREAFDPERAAAMGVPEGPKFGRLANGQPVTIDGETIHPADVTRTEERTFDC